MSDEWEEWSIYQNHLFEKYHLWKHFRTCIYHYAGFDSIYTSDRDIKSEYSWDVCYWKDVIVAKLLQCNSVDILSLSLVKCMNWKWESCAD